jgi:hypothetical protein
MHTYTHTHTHTHQRTVVVSTERDRTRSVKYNNFKRAILIGEAACAEAERLLRLAACTPSSESVVVNNTRPISPAAQRPAIMVAPTSSSASSSSSSPATSPLPTQSSPPTDQHEACTSTKKSSEPPQQSKKQSVKPASTGTSTSTPKKQSRKDERSTPPAGSKTESGERENQSSFSSEEDKQSKQKEEVEEKLNSTKGGQAEKSAPANVSSSAGVESAFWEALVGGNLSRVNTCLGSGEVVLLECDRQKHGRVLFSLDELPLDVAYTGTELRDRQIRRTGERRCVVDGDTVVEFE